MTSCVGTHEWERDSEWPPKVVDVSVRTENVRLVIPSTTDETSRETTTAITAKAVRVCVTFDQPIYVHSKIDRYTQVQSASDSQLKRAARITCDERDVRLFPSPRNVSNDLVSMFRTTDRCPSRAQFRGLVFLKPTDGHLLGGDDESTDMLDVARFNAATCRLSFSSGVISGATGLFVSDKDHDLPNIKTSRGDEENVLTIYQFVPKSCDKTDDGMSLVELDSMAASHGLLTATQMLRNPLKLIFDPVLNSVMKPVMNVVVNAFSPELLETLTEQMQHSLNEQVPGDVAEMVAAYCSASITNVVSDAITARLVKRLSDSLTADLGPYLRDTVSEAVFPKLRTSLMDTLSRSIPDRINRALPDLLSRSLLPSLTETLTQSLTHSLTHTLSLSLMESGDDADRESCATCYKDGTRCEQCKSSTLSMYYTGYYATYYSDVYADYYAEYYKEALKNVDKVRHPMSYEGDKRR